MPNENIGLPEVVSTLESLKTAITSLRDHTETQFKELRHDRDVVYAKLDDAQTDIAGLRMDLTSYQEENRRSFGRQRRLLEEVQATMADYSPDLEGRLGSVPG